ncbi:MAG TPA: hypothetical protein VNK04_17340 [Gemmataceae bacterium]|nr:hypothetical protein [Gemmataceae bacterium]
MADNEHNEANEPEVIRHQMEETRASLTEKLETLEKQVVETVQGATAAVAETVESVKEAVQDTVGAVKDTVQDTVESVKDTFNLSLQVERHPWLMVGGSFAAGFLVGSLLPRTSERTVSPPSPWNTPQPDGLRGQAEPTPAPAAAFADTSAAAQPGWLSQLGETFGAEIDQLKGLALGTLLGLVRDLVVQSVPPNVGPPLTDMMNRITTRLGGQVITGPILAKNDLFRRDDSAGRGEPAETFRPMGPPEH